MKSMISSPAGLLQPLPIPEQVWEDVAMDFITGLPNSAGKSAIMVVVDRLTKYGHFCALPNQFTSQQVAEAFTANIIKLHGLPRSIISDRDPLFLSTFWKSLFKLQGTTLSMSSAYHPQTDGQTEVLNKCLEMYLRSFVCDEPKQWVKYLGWAEYWYNTSYQSAAAMTPFQALYGRQPPTLLRYIPGTSTNAAVDQDLRTRDELLHLLKRNLVRAQARMKHQADKKRSDREFNVDDWVLVKLRPYRQKSVALRIHQKLGRKYFGPFQITERVGSVAYKVCLPQDARIHPVFHVSLLKLFIGDPASTSQHLPPLNHEEGFHPQPAAILNFRDLSCHGRLTRQALVHWQDLPLEEASWEDFTTLTQKFPSLNLEDKVHLHEAGDDTNTNTQQEQGPNPAGDTSAEDVSTIPQRVQRIRKRPAALKDYL